MARPSPDRPIHDSGYLEHSSRVEAQILGGEACIVACSAAHDNSAFTLKRELESLAAEFADFGFQLIDRYLTNLPTTHDYQVFLLNTGVAVRHGGHSAFRGATPSSADWVKLAQRKGRCAVIIVAGVPTSQSTTIAEHFRVAAGRRLCIGASAPFAYYSGHKSLDLVRYKAVASGGALHYPAPSTALCILDSNVLLDMEKGARGRLNTDVLDDLRQVVTNLWFQDATPGLAIAELCWPGPNGKFRADRHASLRAAMDAWFDCEQQPGDLNQQHLTRRYEARLSSYRGDERFMDERPDLRHMTIAAYCSFLKLASLSYRIRGFKANQRIELFAEYCDFVGNQLRFVSAFAFQVARDLLVARPVDSEYTKRLLKFGRNILGDLWGASWDIMYLWASDWIETDVEGNPRSLDTVLITADKAMANLRDQLQPASYGWLDSSNNPRRFKLGALELDER